MLGLGCMVWSAHTTSARAGTLALSLGLVLGYGGSVLTLILWFHFAVQRGDL
ncbi:MAG TPA: hypothetical protein VFS44_08850 [Gemmatimonadaceae bacterium]|nr:hypothetical protein [Gemmatimonadaceae bacterium]